jgi:tetratricopeptide (TPR) repeat protein
VGRLPRKLLFKGGIVKVLALALLLPGLAVFAEDPHLAALVTKGDAADSQHQTRVALGLFRQAEQIDPKNLGVVLRISKQYTDLIEQTKPQDAAQRHAEKALEYARRAVELDARNAKAHLSLAICYGRMTDFAGNKAKLEYSKIIRDETTKSLEIDPKDDFGWHVLGRWNFAVTNVNAVLRAMATVVYGGMPVASNEEAARCLKKATELAPQRILHRAELAHVYKVMGKSDLALQEWQNILGLRAADGADEKYQQEARAALEAARSARGSSGSRLTTQR